MVLLVYAVLHVKIACAVVLLFPNLLAVDPYRDGARNQVMVDIQLEPVASQVAGKLRSAVVVHRSAIAGEPEQHECGGTVRVFLGVSRVNLKNAVAILSGVAHQHGLVLDFAAGVIGREALFGARQRGATLLKRSVVAEDPHVISAICVCVAAALGDVVRPLHVELRSYRRPVAAADLRVTHRGQPRKGYRQEVARQPAGPVRHHSVRPSPPAVNVFACRTCNHARIAGNGEKRNPEFRKLLS